VRDAGTVAVRAFNASLLTDPRVDPSLLPAADGTTLLRRRPRWNRRRAVAPDEGAVDGPWGVTRPPLLSRRPTGNRVGDGAHSAIFVR